ncbi:unnamed protein product [Cuscuta europaea]|uniref:Uncharacterized protein n=1 Tax=Cuscuta europaea TaxID=41803 RepID=A0A9P0ZCU3_CUSEU|nr:unnamed protein product [Cuscuta europaea]
MLAMQRDMQSIKMVLESEAKEKIFWKRMWQGLVIFVIAIVVVKIVIVGSVLV